MQDSSLLYCLFPVLLADVLIYFPAVYIVFASRKQTQGDHDSLVGREMQVIAALLWRHVLEQVFLTFVNCVRSGLLEKKCASAFIVM